MHAQQIAFTLEEIVKYIGIVAGLIISGAGIYYLIVSMLKGMDNKIESNTNEITSLKMKVKAIEETHQNVTSSLIEISTTQNSFMSRAEEQWDRQNIDMKRIIDNQSEFNKMIADRFQKTDDRFQKFDENIIKFYKENGHLFHKPDEKG